MQSAYGQFVSILYASMVILFEENGPRADRTFGECRASYASCSGGGSPRTLAIMNRLGQEHRDGVARAKQRGDLIGRLRAMRDLASPAKRADLNVCEADIEPVNGVNDGTVQTLYSTMPLWFCFASWQRGGIADEENGSHLVASIMELHITTRSAVLSRWPDNQLARAHLQLLQRRRWSGLLWLCGAHDGNLVECARHCEGAEYAGVPGQLSLAVKTGSLASIASAAGC